MATSIAPVLGITGAVAAGKSAISRHLGSFGARVIDVDGLGHAALASPAVREAVVREFGRGVLAADGTLDRAALARSIFDGEDARRRLEAIVHPVVRRRIDDEIAAGRAAHVPLIVVDCALLFESGLDAICDTTLAVDAPEALRLARAWAAHGWDEAEVRRRMAAQLPPEDKRARADRVAINDGDESRLADEARSLFDAVVRGAGAAATRRPSS